MQNIYLLLLFYIGPRVLVLIVAVMGLGILAECIISQIEFCVSFVGMNSNSTDTALQPTDKRLKCLESEMPPINLVKLHSPFVGRESNMTYLEQLLLNVSSSGSVHVVGISGPPGFGKSTLANHLGWRMVKNCYRVGYMDLEQHLEVLPYVVKSYNEKRLQEWKPPMELTSNGSDENAVIASSLSDWFVGRALLIVDNCNYALRDQEHREKFENFSAAMIQLNENGRIVFTSDEKIIFTSDHFNYENFPIGYLSTDASVELLKQLSKSRITTTEAETLAAAVENCPVALKAVDSLIKTDNITKEKIISQLLNRKKALNILNVTKKRLSFPMIMDIAFGYLDISSQMSAMYFSFFPGYFPDETAVRILMQSDKKYNVRAGIDNSDIATKSIQGLFYRSMLEKSTFGEVDRYKMHRLIKIYFMNKGEDYDSEIEISFNSSFRIYFSKLGVRSKPVADIRSQFTAEVLSDHDAPNLYYLMEMLLSQFGTHIYSEDELIYLAFAFHKGLLNFDEKLFRNLLRLFTYPHPQLAILPKHIKVEQLNMDAIRELASQFENFYVDVLCEVTTRDVCINVYLDILYRLYKVDKCDEVFEDTMEHSCQMISCDYVNDYFKILDKLEAFSTCSDDFCNLLYRTQYMCSVFESLKSPLKYTLISFFLSACFGTMVMLITCLRIKSLPVFMCKHFVVLVIIWAMCVLPTYTVTARKYFGFYFSAPLEVHSRNLICSVAIIAYSIFVLNKIIIKIVYRQL